VYVLLVKRECGEQPAYGRIRYRDRAFRVSELGRAAVGALSGIVKRGLRWSLGDPAAPSCVQAGILHVFDAAASKEGHTCLPAEEEASGRSGLRQAVAGGMVEQVIR
jgi:hypothetical protein